MQDFRDLRVWKEAHELAVTVYQLTGQFPKQEIYGLTSQLRRAVVSIATNLAEGRGRGTDRDFGRFVQIAMGSACETEYLLLLSLDLQLASVETLDVLLGKVGEVKKMLSGLIKTVKVVDH